MSNEHQDDWMKALIENTISSGQKLGRQIGRSEGLLEAAQLISTRLDAHPELAQQLLQDVQAAMSKNAAGPSP